MTAKEKGARSRLPNRHSYLPSESLAEGLQDCYLEAPPEQGLTVSMRNAQAARSAE
jgi:hypothetical protein